MPKHNTRAAISDRLARRVNTTDTHRLNLLGNLLEESSSIALNDGTYQTSAKQALESHSKLLDLIDEVRQVESSNNPQLPERNEQDWNEFFNWIDSNCKAQLKPSSLIGVAKSDNDDQEYALVAKVPFKMSTNIYYIHRRVMLSTETAIKDSDLFEFIKNDPIASTMQNVVLALHLLNEHSKGSRSYWSQYLAILPNKILPVLKLNKEKLQHLLASAHIFEILKMIRAIARQYSYFFKRLQSANLPLSKNFTYEYYCWGVSVVCSRQNEIPPSDRLTYSLPVVHALIPILDMCNHDYTSNQATFEENQSKLAASKDLKVGDEITINYGCRSSGDFYIHNGFVPNDVPFDIVPLVIILSQDTPLYLLKAKLLKILNMPTFGRFRLTRMDHLNRHKRDPHLTMFLIVYFLNKDEVEFILDNENPVGIADEIYEYVQYFENGLEAIQKSRLEQNVSNKQDEEDKAFILTMQNRLYRCVKEYLSRRASIGIALLDRVLQADAGLDLNLLKLLEHEKTIYLSYLINPITN